MAFRKPLDLTDSRADHESNVGLDLGCNFTTLCPMEHSTMRDINFMVNMNRDNGMMHMNRDNNMVNMIRDNTMMDLNRDDGMMNPHRDNSMVNPHRDNSMVNPHRDNSMVNSHRDNSMVNQHRDISMVNMHRDNSMVNIVRDNSMMHRDSSLVGTVRDMVILNNDTNLVNMVGDNRMNSIRDNSMVNINKNKSESNTDKSMVNMKPQTVIASSVEASTKSSSKNQGKPVGNKNNYSEQSQQIVLNVYKNECRKKVKGAIARTAKSTGIHRLTISKIVKAGVPKTPKKPGSKKKRYAKLDNFMRDDIRQIIHAFYKDGQPPTIDMVYQKLNQKDAKFPYGKSHLRNIIKSLGFKHSRVNKRTVIMESPSGDINSFVLELKGAT